MSERNWLLLYWLWVPLALCSFIGTVMTTAFGGGPHTFWFCFLGGLVGYYCMAGIQEWQKYRKAVDERKTAEQARREAEKTAGG